jgi:hypothetical protein
MACSYKPTTVRLCHVSCESVGSGPHMKRSVTCLYALFFSLVIFVLFLSTRDVFVHPKCVAAVLLMSCLQVFIDCIMLRV